VDNLLWVSFWILEARNKKEGVSGVYFSTLPGKINRTVEAFFMRYFCKWMKFAKGEQKKHSIGKE